MTIKLFKLWAASVCAVFACYLPQSLGQPHEVSVSVSHVQALQALPEPKVVSLTGLNLVPLKTDVYTGTGDYYLDKVVQHESGGNPYAVNSIGACGLFQSLPCNKMDCSLSDVNCQLKWGQTYVGSVYGSSYAAWQHELAFNWY